MEPEKLEPAVDYLETIGEDEEVLIVHHWDMDGISSSAIISKILEELRGRPADEVTIPVQRSYHLTEEDMEKVDSADRLIVLDFNLGAEELEELDSREDLEVLVVDHHSFEDEPDVHFVNPRAQNSDAYIPCSMITQEIAEEFGIGDETRWIAGLGIIQDFGVENCRELFEELDPEYDRYLPGKIEQEELAKNCEYGRYSSVLNIKPYRDSEKYSRLAYQALMNSGDLKELEAQEEYRKVYEVYLEMQDEFNDAVENYDEEREIDRDKMIIFFDLESDFHIRSSIATNMSTRNPEWIHLVLQIGEERVNVSGRCQSGRVDLGRLMQEALPEEAVEEGAEAGGHEKAAGASMKKEYLEEFKQRFTERVE
ncbi:MAG: DHH family phosphoesterase [Candidatus Nanohaloarchaea archaeon]